MKIPNHNNSAKPIFLVSILVISIIALGFLVPTVDAANPVGKDTVTKSGLDPIIFLRDFANPLNQTDADGNSLSTVTYDVSTNPGFVTITVTDVDANMDRDGTDFVLVSVNSTTSGAAKAQAELEETSVNSGTFSGKLLLSSDTTTGSQLELSSGDNVSVLYDPEPLAVGRLLLDLSGTSGVANVVMKDVIITSNRCTSGLNLVTNPVDIQITGATATGISVKIAATNELGLDKAFANSLMVLYKASDTFTWKSLTPMGDLSGHNLSFFPTLTGTISNVLQPTTNLIPGDFSGQYALGYSVGCPGGGGGGLVRPGFVVNALAGANVISSLFGKGGALTDFTGGSKNGPANPIVTSGTVNILSDESIGFVQQGVTSDSGSDSTSKSLDSTQNVVIGKDLTFKYNVFEDKGTDNLIHATMYFFDVQMMDANDRIDVSKSETYIMYEKGKPVKVVDPYGYFEKAALKISETDVYNSALNYEVTFGKIMPESHIVLRTWDGQRYSTDTLYENAIVVSENSIADNDDTSTDNEPLTQSEFETSPFLDTQYESQLTKDETKTKTGFPGIPLWVKNNAMWWYEKQIDDADFVAGIQYMINEEIITIPKTTITSSTTEGIPQWVSNVAGYWSNDQIPDDQFVQAMQWLVSNGVMEV